MVWELEQASSGYLELRHRMGNCSSSMPSERLQPLSAAGLVSDARSAVLGQRVFVDCAVVLGGRFGAVIRGAAVCLEAGEAIVQEGPVETRGPHARCWAAQEPGALARSGPLVV